ncbi:MAG: hypothetical protein M0R48_04030 [Candidatus Omnitrophica bacterium]|jgi:hypothetical protein|nr:hypothetical protein [Candidatus Omnitrophota bacterium]
MTSKSKKSFIFMPTKAEWRQLKLIFGISVLVALAIPIVITMVCRLGQRKDERELAPFVPHETEYGTIIKAALGSSRVQTSTSNLPLTIRGKLLPMWRGSNGQNAIALEELRQLPGTLRPRSHEEVGTLVIWESEKVQIGCYDDKNGNGANAYKHYIYLTFVDVQTASVIARYTFTGSDPSQVIRRDFLGGFVDGEGSYPLDEARVFIRSVTLAGKPAGK